MTPGNSFHTICMVKSSCIERELGIGKNKDGYLRSKVKTISPNQAWAPKKNPLEHSQRSQDIKSGRRQSLVRWLNLLSKLLPSNDYDTQCLRHMKPN